MQNFSFNNVKCASKNSSIVIAPTSQILHNLSTRKKGKLRECLGF